MKKGWAICTPTQELFDEVISYNVATQYPLQSEDWVSYGRHTTVCHRMDDNKFMLCSYDFLKFEYPEKFECPEKFDWITIEQFREMVGSVKQASVGDINSEAKGSGARYNSGKPDYSMLLLSDLGEYLGNVVSSEADGKLTYIISTLGKFQETHDPFWLGNILETVGIEAIEESTHVFTYGAKKYKAWNWAKGMPWSVPLACAVRHTLAILNGEEVDAESRRKHIAHVVCNIMMLIHYTKHYKEGNDLPPLNCFSTEDV